MNPNRSITLKRPQLLLFVTSWLLLTCGTALANVTFESLLEEMVNRDVVAQWPAHPYACKQSSSYDRDSSDPNNADTWYANWDRSQFVRTEERADGRKEYVLMDETGPGAVVRFWGTWHGPQGGKFSNGTLRVYLDGEDKPAIEGPIREILSGGALVGPPLSDYVSKKCPVGNRAHNLYLPIPYAKQCKITYETDVLVDQGGRQGEALYYQINYRSYEPSTAVRTFAQADLSRHHVTIERVQSLLAERADRSPQEGDDTADLSGTLAVGQSREITMDGPAAIRSLRFRLQADDTAQALRSTVLEISFDGQRTVWCPVGDFFGAAYQPQSFKTWYTAASDDNLLSAQWVMPFASSATVRVHNLGDTEVDLDVAEIVTSDWDWDDRSMHFHTTWREYANYATQNTNMSGRNGPKDENYVTIDGQGVYVGDTLSLFDAAPAWWGEGDEKIYVDGETFPSHFGTGTEDYYGYAWCRGEYFSNPFHAQPIGDGNLGTGPAVNSRFRTLDAIPFEKSYRFDMEIWSWASTKINYAPTTFWYARPGAKSNVEPLPALAKAPIAKEVDDLVPVYRAKGAIEGESLEVARRTGGTSEVQDGPQFGWSGQQQIWWRDANVGDELEMHFDVERSGSHKISAELTKAEDYGIVRISIDGKELENEFDLYAERVEHSTFDLGEHRLDAGKHTMTIRIVGANKRAIKRYMFGLDYLMLRLNDPIR